MRRIDNQIDVLSKTFLGLTVACARCHDHKFDPITSKDYYALAGFLHSSRHQQGFIDPPERIGAGVRRLRELKEAIAAIAPRRQGPVAGTAPRPGRRPDGLHGDRPGAAAAATGRHANEDADRVFEDFNRDDFDGWFVTGDAFGDRPSRRGRLSARSSGADRRGWSRSSPARRTAAWCRTGSRACCARGPSRSRRATSTIWSRGEGGRINVVIDGFEKIRDPDLRRVDDRRRTRATGRAG